jgi:hypothetical protein
MEYVEGMEKCVQILVGKPAEKKTFDIRDARGKMILKLACAPDSSG